MIRVYNFHRKGGERREQAWNNKYHMKQPAMQAFMPNRTGNAVFD